jgi:hypothetical protein
MNLVQTEMGLQVRSNGLPSDRELPLELAHQTKVTGHPRGGWTIATHGRVGSAWIYHGQFSTRAQAQRLIGMAGHHGD